MGGRVMLEEVVLPLVVAVGLATLVGCAVADRGEAPRSEDPTSVAAAVIALEEGALHRWRQGDPDGFLDLIADDYTYFDPFVDERVDGKPAISSIYDRLRGQVNFPRFELVAPRVQVLGDVAVLTFNFRGFGPDAGGLEVQQSDWHTTEVFARIGETWQLVSTHWSFTGPQLERLEAAGRLSDLPVVVADAPAQPPVGDGAAVLALERQALDRWGEGNPDGYLELLLGDSTYFDPSLAFRLDGLERTRAHLEPVRGTFTIDRDEILEPRVQLFGSAAVLTFNYASYARQPDGSEQLGAHWHSTEVYSRAEGGWRLASTHWSYSASMLARLARAGAFSGGAPLPS